MTRRGTHHLCKELEAVLTRVRQEYEMTYAEVVGCLELVKSDVIREAASQGEKGDEDDT